MSKIYLLVLLFLAFSLPARADCVYVGRLPWSRASVKAVHGPDLPAVVKFVNATQPADALAEIAPNQVAEFAWANVGGGKTDLVVALDFSGRGFYTLWIYSQGSGDKLVIQQFRGWKMWSEGLKGLLRDLNGDVVDELVIPTNCGWPWWCLDPDDGGALVARDLPVGERPTH